VAATEPTSAEDVLMIIYTSGTTGRPKGAVHTHCGFPDQGRAGHAPQHGSQAGETFWWFTDMGWMMGPWLVFGSLLNGAAMLFYDGAPDYPGPDRLWAICARHGVTHLGITPSLIRALKPHGEEPVRRHDLSVPCAPSAPPAARGTRKAGCGPSRPCSRGASRSSTTPAARRSAAASSAATSSRR
jgi:acetyl-CoA synthetase